MNVGYLYATACYLLWGVFPVYWKLLADVPTSQILAHRMVWAFVFLCLILTVKKDWGWLKTLKEKPSQMLVFMVITAFISANWYVYTWAVTAGHIVETSLGYFMNPLVNVLLGVTFLGERPRKGQLIAILIAFVGVSYMTISLGKLPWIALVLAFSFGLYGLLKKTVALGPIRGMTLETAYMLIPAVIYLVMLSRAGTSYLFEVSLQTDLLLMGAGVVTAIPLLLFAAAARNMSLTSLGVFQYIAPSLQFLIGVFVYSEPFSRDKLIGFIFVWVALVVFAAESLSQRRCSKTPHFLERVK